MKKFLDLGKFFNLDLGKFQPFDLAKILINLFLIFFILLFSLLSILPFLIISTNTNKYSSDSIKLFLSIEMNKLTILLKL